MAMTASARRYDSRSVQRSTDMIGPASRPKSVEYSSGDRSCWSKMKRLPASLNGQTMAKKRSGGLHAWMTSKPGDLASSTMSRRVLASATRYSVICVARAAGGAGRLVRAVARHQHAVEVLAEGLVAGGGQMTLTS